MVPLARRTVTTRVYRPRGRPRRSTSTRVREKRGLRTVARSASSTTTDVILAPLNARRNPGASRRTRRNVRWRRDWQLTVGAGSGAGVVVGVGNQGRVEFVVGAVVPGDFRGEFGEFRCSIGRG